MSHTENDTYSSCFCLQPSSFIQVLPCQALSPIIAKGMLGSELVATYVFRETRKLAITVYRDWLESSLS